jgi:hypothetical protein
MNRMLSLNTYLEYVACGFAATICAEESQYRLGNMRNKFSVHNMDWVRDSEHVRGGGWGEIRLCLTISHHKIKKQKATQFKK